MKMREIKKTITPKMIAVFGAVLVFIISIWVLYAGENVGLSDNGDFGRVIFSNDIDYIDRQDNNYKFIQYYKMNVQGENLYEKLVFLWTASGDMDGGSYSSPHFIPVKISKVASYIANLVTGQSEGVYNIYWLALIYIVLYALAAYLIVSFFTSKKMQVFVLACLLFFFCDAGYILYFNSFYGEAFQLTSLMLLIGLGLKLYRKRTVGALLFFYVTLYCFAGSKLANIPIALVIALFSFIFLFLDGRKYIKIAIAVFSITSVALLLSLYFSAPRWMEFDTTYQSVFFGILKESPSPQKDLQELGLNPEYAELQNTNAYMRQYPIHIHSPEFENDLLDHVNKVNISLFYLKHPVRLMKKLNIAVKNAAYIRPAYLGNTTDGRLVLTDRFSMWSRIRAYYSGFYKLWPVFGLLMLLILCAVIGIVRYIRRGKGNLVFHFAVMTTVLSAMAALALPIIGNGEADIAKHEFLFVHLFDIIMAGLLMMAVYKREKIFVLIKNKRFLTLAVVCLLAIHAHEIVGFVRLRTDIVTFGSYNRRPIKWQIIAENPDGSKQMISMDILEYRPFSADNRWDNSDIRAWLNGEFLRGFNDEEIGRLITAQHKVLLTTQKHPNDPQDHPHFWTYEPSTVASLYDSAYQDVYEDKVVLPNLQQIQNGTFSKRKQAPYWTTDPYAGNARMVRYVNTDGFVLHADADRVMGIRPVITIE